MRICSPCDCNYDTEQCVLVVLGCCTCTAQRASGRELRTVWRVRLVSWRALHPGTHFDLNLGASALLLLSSLPRASKGPVPAVLTVTSAASTYYYGKTVYAVRQ